MSTQTLLTLTDTIAEAMLETKGNLVAVSRLPDIDMNAMQLRRYVSDHPEVRDRYTEMLTQELTESGLHITERILAMSKMQQEAYGNPELDIPADPKMAIELSKEISRLIAEGKGANMSANTALVLTSKEGAAELLAAFLNT